MGGLPGKPSKPLISNINNVSPWSGQSAGRFAAFVARVTSDLRYRQPKPKQDYLMKLTPDKVAAIADDLRGIINYAGPGVNKNDLAKILITVCMEADLNTQKSILGAIKAAGFNVGHAARLLKLETHHSKSWQQDVEGTFFLNDRARL